MNRNAAIMLGVLVVFALAGPALAQMSAPVAYQGRWEIQPNGDVKVSMEYRLGLDDYRTWKSRDVHMLVARGFAASRSPVAVAQRDARWNDMDRTLTMTMTVQGMAQNFGDHWEAIILPGLKFSNLDESKKIAYFHFASDTPMGRVEGQDHVLLPADARAPAWKDSSRKIVYELPYVAPSAPAASAKPAAVTKTVADTRTVSSPMPVIYLILFGVALAVGLMLLALSFVPRRQGP